MELDVQDDSEINWNTLLSDPSWNLWSAHQIQRRWLTMKRAIKGYESMSFRELLDILKERKGVIVED